MSCLYHVGAYVYIHVHVCTSMYFKWLLRGVGYMYVHVPLVAKYA